MRITPEARENLREFMRDHEDGFVRVARLTTGGACCAKLTLGVTLDDERDEENDLLFTVENLPVVIEKSLYSSLADLRISFDQEKGIIVSHGGG
ncbi:MAG: hypothetical protein LBQ10_07010 [Desulfovibrio sp.]|jgi:Fe-S cluster assembly iron-binding protein IscA|nr:hypothetical protein [Desulfovibrio sp.]